MICFVSSVIIEGMEHHSGNSRPSSHSETSNDNSSGEVKTFLAWSAPARPFRKKGRQFFASVGLLVIFIEIILFLFSEYALMATALALAFLAVALSSVPPRNFHYKISNQGLMIEDYFYIWDELYDFYFKKIDGMITLVVHTQAFLPGELKISLGDIPEEQVKRTLIPFLPYREIVKPSFMEKSSDWLSRNFPLEK